MNAFLLKIHWNPFCPLPNPKSWRRPCNGGIFFRPKMKSIDDEAPVFNLFLYIMKYFAGLCSLPLFAIYPQYSVYTNCILWILPFLKIYDIEILKNIQHIAVLIKWNHCTWSWLQCLFVTIKCFLVLMVLLIELG